MGIEKHYDEIAHCNRCGFCQGSCPIFRATGHEAGVARGRVALMRALVEKRIEWNRDLEEPLFACLLCGACTDTCFPGVRTADMILDARSEYLERVGRNSLHRLLFNHLLPYPKRLRLAARAAAMGKRTGLSKVAKSLGLLRIFGRDFPKAEEIVEQFPAESFRESVTDRTFEGLGQGRIGFFVGCGTDIVCPETARATLDLLRGVGTSVEILENCCCGLPPVTYGDQDAGRNLAAKNLDLLSEDAFDVVATDCSSCASFLKKYPTLFDENDPLRAKAESLAARVRDLSELLTDNTDAQPADDTEKLVVTYHDPCHASRGQGIAARPREILGMLPGVEFRELPEADWCCGGAGSYATTHYALSRDVLDRKMDNLEKTKADVLATSCPACIIHLRYGIRKRGLSIRVAHLSELVAERTS